jgi:hypothetical protein
VALFKVNSELVSNFNLMPNKQFLIYMYMVYNGENKLDFEEMFKCTKPMCWIEFL